MKYTISDRIVATGGRATGFDYLRILLALSIVFWHTVIVTRGFAAQTAAYAGPFRPLIATILPLFFALSGFLVAGSLERTPSLKKFLGLRALRIFPALAVETIVCAFILGPVLTAFSLHDYFHNALFYRYLVNVIGVIHYELPGLFLSNPEPSTVNGQLWTVPFELECYITLALSAFFNILKRPRLLIAIIFGASFIILIGKLIHNNGHAIVTVGPVNGHLLVVTFLAAVYVYLLRDKIPYNATLFFVALAAYMTGLSVPVGDCFIAFPAAYVTVYLGLRNPKARLLHKLGDLSYGIFLFSFPVQQTIANVGGVWAHVWYMNLAAALPASIFFAFCSWNLVEKPALSLKRFLKTRDSRAPLAQSGNPQAVDAFEVNQGHFDLPSNNRA